MPFLVAALAYRRALGAFAVVRRHRGLVTRIGGIMLVTIGVLLATGEWGQLVGHLQGVVTGFEPVI